MYFFGFVSVPALFFFFVLLFVLSFYCYMLILLYFFLLFSDSFISDSQAFVSVQRINTFLCSEDLDDNNVTYDADAGTLPGMLTMY